MELDPKDVIHGAEKAVTPTEAPSGRLNAIVAITVAILATFMGI